MREKIAKAEGLETNCVIYCRVSSKEQVEGTSLESQEIACREYAKSHNIKILKVFVERGESAKVADRTQLVELIDFCRTSKDKVQALLVWKLDRFARNVGDHFNIKATLAKYGVRVVSVTEPIDSNPEGKLMEAILAGFAQFDNDIRAARTIQGMRRKIQEGIFPWKPPLGYLSPERDSGKKTVPDEPDQPLFGLLQKAWREFATGAHTKAGIKRLLDSLGIETKNGIQMTPQSLDNLFRNPYYAGILVDPWSGEEFQGKHTPMVTSEEFANVQATIAKRNRSTPHERERVEFPLRGVSRCTTCGHYLTGAFSRGRSNMYPYYRCVNRLCAFRPSHPTGLAHEEFKAFLEEIAPKHEIIDLLGRRILKATEDKESNWKAHRQRKKAEVGRFEREIQELIRMKTQGLITEPEFVHCKAAIAKRQQTLSEVELPQMPDARDVQGELETVVEPLAKLAATWETIPLGFHRRFNHMVLPAGSVIGKYRTAQLGPVFSFFRMAGDISSREVALTGENLNQLYQAIRAFADLFREIEEQKKAA
jgi:site-specific DNA recombinase